MFKLKQLKMKQLKLKHWICSSLLLVVSVVPALAGAKDATDAKASSETTATPGAPPAAAAASPTLSPGNANVTALLGVLVMKGVLSPTEANSIRNANPTAQFDALVEALSRKGVLSAADLAPAASPTAVPAAAPAAQPAVPALAPSSVTVAAVTPAVAPLSVGVQASQAPSNPSTPEREHPAPPAVVPAVAPLRVLPLDPPVRDGLLAGFKVGAVKVTPYGFIKATAVRDSSDPDGDDFPYPGIFLQSSNPLSTGPTLDPSFHLKARSTRFGANFEWLDLSKKLTLTGKVEGDFEGGFSEVDNADVSSIRNPTPRLRLAYVRMDYAATDRSDLFFEGGQNWSLFGSSAVSNLLETTFFGAYSGDIWERTPQFRFGVVQKLGTSDRNWKFSPEIALMMPSTGEIMKLNSINPVGGFEAQIGEAERQGADSGRPELEARAVLQFQLDKAPAVAPAQLIWAGYDARRTSITPSSALSATPSDLKAQFASGFTSSSNLYGNQLAIQLPTRWATLVASGYRGGDMRFMLAGQLNTYYTDPTGLYNVQTVQTLDNVNEAAGLQQVGCTVAITAGTCSASGGVWQVARQRPIGSFGGFINLGLPLSRWFKADPKGHNAGWQLYLNAGKDQVVHKDLAKANGFGCGSADGLTGCTGGLPLLQSRLLAATLYYKVNNWATFAFEQSQYQTTLLPDVVGVGVTYSIAGQPASKWKDQRTEFGPIFTF
jgi:hypothetical protein